MIEGSRVLGVITARGGSKGVPRKNVRNIAGKPLIGWTIEEAKKSQYLDNLILSSDDEEIISVAQSFECEVPFIRPSELALDGTLGIEPVLHAIDNVKGYDYVVLLQPTSPLRSAIDIDRCIEICIAEGYPSCVSVSESIKSPYWMYKLNVDGTLDPLLKIENRLATRQELPVSYVLNGAIYVAKIGWLKEQKSFLHKETGAYIMPQERSYDIDTAMDFEFVEFLMKKRSEC
ncbi:CMP-N,N'-diacetyllegionaminic acid synthase [Paenibacillus allorhizoplanae]|uniref:CMP-N,N'-diacetyllegionaminic acid synthase n=1 Tax=Paenibacillus allorhizoplanae TaxID=2905648 RepID=A0ABN8GYP1_9BACL|nr:acylneuraminate cytidylyltransferase family protein [Paenibacillus allorhizoplanae]CAH1215781.1 CMP-N,N'-diacetyllegionaminic acid synthase [Paenibacillus allorhizoplanae]